MIVGSLIYHGGAILPAVRGILYVPRLAVSRTIVFIVDTGAARTVLSLRDSLSMFPAQQLSKLGNIEQCTGMGGKAQVYTEDNTRIVFQHHDGNTEDTPLRLSITKDSPGQTNAFLQLPSVLGCDVLSRFRLLVDYPAGRVVLSRPPGLRRG